MKVFLFTLSFFLITHLASAQILKVDKGSIDSDSSNYFMGSINIDFNLNNKSATAEKNITYTGLEGSSDLVYVGNRHAYILINDISYIKSTGGPLISSGYTHFRINFLRKRKLSYESFSQVQYDNGRQMPFRFLQGAGIKIRLKKSGKNKIFMGIGAMYERENWNSLETEGKIISKNIWKTSNYITSKLTINENVDFNIIVYYQGGYDYDDEVFRHRVSGDAVLNIKLTDKLAFNTSFTAQYEDKPIIPINNFVYSLTNGFKFTF
ncbi:DUF481 domain-containing protein [Fulvivirga sediminis]|uniref:DUF481 domain-containing protein n=1 Tax=Fulvivirga sediminis TaxID=2803949 RepID=A0A937JYR4_9BACT|nr:DUF481 domain-containing protein [Fulvivirga sediminis]MBL3656678.1 DUF481 domain-containing protein [Fulvivirga sediminis]